MLCSHFLFLYEGQFDYAFHRDAVLEMMRVCKTGGTLRIYPVMSLGWTPYARMEELLDADSRPGRSAWILCNPSCRLYLGSELGLFVNL